MDKSGCRNPQIIATDEPANGSKCAIDFTVLPGNLFRPRQHGVRTAQFFPVSSGCRRLPAGKFSRDRKSDEKRLTFVTGQKLVRSTSYSATGIPLRCDNEIRIED